VIPSGSNITVKWYINDVLTNQTSYENHGNYVENITITSKSTVRVATVASNAISEASHNLTFQNFYKINGISFFGDEATSDTDVNIVLKMGNEGSLPQGQFSIHVDFGDSTSSEVIEINSENDTLKTPGLSFTHPYNVEGNYTAKANVTSPIDSQTYTSLVQIMEPIKDIQVGINLI
jgi:hypothetical protein